MPFSVSHKSIYSNLYVFIAHLTERTGRPLISSLELITRYTTVLWSYANSYGVKPRPGAVVPPKSSTESSAMDVDNGNNNSEVSLQVISRLEER